MKGYFFLQLLRAIDSNIEFNLLDWLGSVFIEALIAALVTGTIASLLFDEEFGRWFTGTAIVVLAIEVIGLFLAFL